MNKTDLHYARYFADHGDTNISLLMTITDDFINAAQGNALSSGERHWRSATTVRHNMTEEDRKITTNVAKRLKLTSETKIESTFYNWVERLNY